MKKLTIIFILTVLTLGVHSQISNPGFENHMAVPTELGQMDRCNDWFNAGSATSTPDYYHYHALGDVDLPNTLSAVVEAWEGNAIMGFVACGSQGTDKREYISTKLTEATTIGQDYLVSFRICNGYITPNSYTGYGVDNLGIALTTGIPSQNNDEPLLIPTKFEIDSVFFDRDWTQFSFIFNADQAYEYLTLGVFDVDVHLNFVAFEDNAVVTYYFVDDFFMMELPEDYDPTLADVPKGDTSSTVDPEVPEETEDSLNPFFIPNAFTPNGDGENDIFVPVSEFPDGLKGYIFEIYSRWGELIFTTDEMNVGWDGFYNGELMEDDVFVWNITYQETKREQVFTKKYNGSVVLIR